MHYNCGMNTKINTEELLYTVFNKSDLCRLYFMRAKPESFISSMESEKTNFCRNRDQTHIFHRVFQYTLCTEAFLKKCISKN